MKSWVRFLVVALPALVVGWVLGYIRLPMVEKDAGFWVGILGGAAALLLVWALQNRWLRRKQSASPTGSWLGFIGGASVLLAVGSVVALGVMYGLFQQSRQELKALHVLSEAQKRQIESLQASQNGKMLDNLLDLINQDLQDGARQLQPSTLERIRTFSLGVGPTEVSSDPFEMRGKSPERGQLLLALLAMDLDTSSWREIKSTIAFAYADLEGALLAGKDLSGIDLQSANLKGANLEKVDLKGANLRFSNLKEALLDSADLSRADLLQSDLEWAQGKGLNAIKAVFNGASLANVQFQDADLRGCKLRFVSGPTAQFMGSDFRNADFKASRFSGANFQKANVKGANLNMTDLQFSRFQPLGLDSVRVGKGTWPENLQVWHQENNSEGWEKRYLIVRDSTQKFEAEYLILRR
jgi:hypothetical protein